MHWSVPVTAIIGFDRVHFFLLLRLFLTSMVLSSIFAVVVARFSGTKRNESKPPTPPSFSNATGMVIHSHALQNSLFRSLIRWHAINIQFQNGAKQNAECELSVPFYFPSHFHLAMSWFSHRGCGCG